MSGSWLGAAVSTWAPHEELILEQSGVICSILAIFCAKPEPNFLQIRDLNKKIGQPGSYPVASQISVVSVVPLELTQ